MDVKRTVLWAIVALLIGVTVGFGFRGVIASSLGFQAAETVQIIGPGDPQLTGARCKANDTALCTPVPKCQPPKIWTGNGCADPRTWTNNDVLFFLACLANAMNNPPPPLPDHAVTPSEYASCAQQTEGGKGR